MSDNELVDYFQGNKQLAEAVEILTQADKPHLAMATLRSAKHISILDAWRWIVLHGYGESKAQAIKALKVSGYDLEVMVYG